MRAEFRINWPVMALTTAIGGLFLAGGLWAEGTVGNLVAALGGFILFNNAIHFPFVWYGRYLDRKLARVRGES